MKLKIMNSKPDISDEEIRSYMNFDGLMKDFKAIPKKSPFSTLAKIAAVVGGVIIVAAVSYFIGLKSQERGKAPEPKSNSEISSPDPAKENPQIKRDSVTLLREKEASVIEKEVVAKKTNPDQLRKNVSLHTEQPKSIEKKHDSTKVATSSGYLQAEPVNGFPHLYEYFSSELKYPEEAVKDSIQGIVTVTFIIGKEGKPEKISILNSLGQSFDKEVIRLIENMPAWKPASMDDFPVPSKISMPLTFRLERIKK